jgi:integrase
MTGLRRGEALGLRWQDLDLEAQTLKVNQSLVVVEGRSMFTTPKTDAGKRTVSLDPRTVAVLRAHRKAQTAEGSLRDLRGLTAASCSPVRTEGRSRRIGSTSGSWRS